MKKWIIPLLAVVLLAIAVGITGLIPRIGEMHLSGYSTLSGWSVDTLKVDSNSLIIEGWAAGVENTGKRKTSIVLENEGKQHIYKADLVARTDVRDYLNSLGTVSVDTDILGFSGAIEIAGLDDGVYTIGIFMEDGGTKHFTMTNRTVAISGGKASITGVADDNVTTQKEPADNSDITPGAFISSKVDSIGWTTDENLKPRHSGIDTRTMTGDGPDSNLIVEGWIVLDQNTEAKEVAVVLLTKGDSLFFNTELTERNDVVTAFQGEEGLSFQTNRVGFRAVIPAPELPAEDFTLALSAKDGPSFVYIIIDDAGMKDVG